MAQSLLIIMRIPFLVLLIMVLIAPALALGNYEITAEPLGGQSVFLGPSSDLTYDASAIGMAIQRFSADLPSGTTVNYTLTYGSGKTVDGWFQYTHEDTYSCNWLTGSVGCRYTDVGIGSMSNGYFFVDDSMGLFGRLDIIGYAHNSTDKTPGIIVYDTVAGLSQGAVAFFPTGSGAQAIYKIHITSSQPIKYIAYINTRANVEAAASKSLVDIVSEWITFVEQFAGVAKDFIINFFYWLQFFFITGWKVVLVLILVVPMAFAAKGSGGNPDKFLTRYFKTMKGFFMFVLLVWAAFVGIIGTVRGWFRI